MKRLTMLIACVLSIGWAQAQVSNNNEDEVYKMVNPRQASMDFVPGEVLVKMKDASPVKVRRAKGKFQNTDNKTLDAVLAEFGIEEMEQVLPGEKRRTNLRRAKAPNGGFIEEHDLSQLYRIRMAQPDLMKTRQLVQKLEEVEEVEFAEPNYRAYIMGEVDHGETISPNPGQNPSYTLQWGIPALKINELWTKPLVNSKRPVIAISCFRMQRYEKWHKYATQMARQASLHRKWHKNGTEMAHFHSPKHHIFAAKTFYNNN